MNTKQLHSKYLHGGRGDQTPKCLQPLLTSLSLGSQQCRDQGKSSIVQGVLDFLSPQKKKKPKPKPTRQPVSHQARWPTNQPATQQVSQPTGPMFLCLCSTSLCPCSRLSMSLILFLCVSLSHMCTHRRPHHSHAHFRPLSHNPMLTHHWACAPGWQPLPGPSVNSLPDSKFPTSAGQDRIYVYISSLTPILKYTIL